MSDPAFMPFSLPDVGQAEIDAVSDAIRSGWLTTGPNAAAFETEFADAVGGDVIGVAVNSATAAMHLGLEAMGIKPGDEVLVPTWTFTATAEVVRYLGADPVFVDAEEGTLNISLDRAAEAVTSRTRAIIPVHFAGLPVDRHRLAGFARENRLQVLEDAAHAFPALSSDIPVGRGDSEAVAFSFYANKTMTTGEGGMLVTGNGDIARRAQTMRLHGMDRITFDRYRSDKAAWRYEIVAAGYKYNLSDPAAAMGRVQLRRAEGMRARRESIARTYDEAFRDLPLRLPAKAELRSTHAWHLYVVRVTDDSPVARDTFIERMRSFGIGCSVHFIPLHKHPYWRDLYSLDDAQFPVSSREFERVVSIPLFSAMSDGDVQRVLDAVRSILSL